MSEQIAIRYTAPVQRMVLNDPHLFARLADLLMGGARAEADRACEGRPYTVDRVRMAVRDDGPSFVRNLFDAELEILITPAD